MKKFFSMLFLAIAMFTTTSAQEASEHLTFKGIPIDGTLNNFVTKLTKKGFTHIGTTDGIAILLGDFATYKKCSIGVMSSKDKDVVTSVCVQFPTCETWSTLETNYLLLKQMLTTKYGEPSDCLETFQSDWQPKDDNEKMYMLRTDKCKYYTAFKTEKGGIVLQLTHQNVLECRVTLSYIDAINYKAATSDAMDDL